MMSPQNDERTVSTTISSPLNDRRSRDGRKNVTKAGKGGKRRHDGTLHHDSFGEYMDMSIDQASWGPLEANATDWNLW